MLIEHLAKGDPVDIGNFAMMLFNRGERTVATSAGEADTTASAAQAQPAAAPADDLFEEMVEAGYTALAEHSDGWRSDPEASPASGRESFAVALRAALSLSTPVTAAAPAGDAKDAARWRWMREHWFYFGTMHSRTTVLGMNLHRVNIAGDTHTLDVAVDAGITDDAAMSASHKEGNK